MPFTTAFFVQVERHMLPTLKDVPCAVQQHQDIIAVSYEARALGVTKHMPPAQVRQKYPTVKLVHVAQRGTSGKVTYRNYRQACKVTRSSTAHAVLLPTHSIFTLVAAHCSLLEKASIDEAYLAPTLAELAPYLTPAALRALPGSAKQHQQQQQQQQQQPVVDELAEALLDAGAAFALHIQSTLRDSLQYQCSVGVAENKLLAKLATAEAKPAGVFALQRRRVTASLNETPATALPGCGPDSATGAAFKHAGVRCIADLRRADVEAIVRQAEAGLLCASVSDTLLDAVYEACSPRQGGTLWGSANAGGRPPLVETLRGWGIGSDAAPVKRKPPGESGTSAQAYPLAHTLSVACVAYTLPVKPWQCAEISEHLTTLAEDLLERAE
eukprot:17094-Heterococcus_DN1.PRE.1